MVIFYSHLFWGCGFCELRSLQLGAANGDVPIYTSSKFGPMDVGCDPRSTGVECAAFDG